MTRKNIIVLGINDGHDAGAALVQDGKVIAAVHEERLNNAKGFRGIPEKAIPKVFDISHTNPSDLNLTALASYYPPGGENQKALSTKSLIRLSPRQSCNQGDTVVATCVNANVAKNNICVGAISQSDRYTQ